MKKEECGQLNILERYLKEHGIKYERIDKEKLLDNEKRIAQMEIHQINALDDTGNKLWDVIFHPGSYGYEQGKLELYGCLVDEGKDGDSVAGWLTAQDVIERIERKTP